MNILYNDNLIMALFFLPFLQNQLYINFWRHCPKLHKLRFEERLPTNPGSRWLFLDVRSLRLGLPIASPLRVPPEPRERFHVWQSFCFFFSDQLNSWKNNNKLNKIFKKVLIIYNIQLSTLKNWSIRPQLNNNGQNHNRISFIQLILIGKVLIDTRTCIYWFTNRFAS